MRGTSAERRPQGILLEEVVGVDDVALDLDALDVGQAAAAHLQRRHLLGLEVGAQLAVGRQRTRRRAISTSRSKPPCRARSARWRG